MKNSGHLNAQKEDNYAELRQLENLIFTEIVDWFY